MSNINPEEVLDDQASPDYPYNGSVEPYDEWREEELLNN